MKKFIALYTILLAAAPVYATEFSAYEYCTSEQQELMKEPQGQAGEDCKRSVRDAAKCCNGQSSGCYVPPSAAAATGGARDQGVITAQANSALAADLGKVVNVCGDTEVRATVKCNSSTQDKDYEKQYRGKVSRLTGCYQAAQGQAHARAVAGGASAAAGSAQSDPCSAPGEKSAEQIVKCLSPK